MQVRRKSGERVEALRQDPEGGIPNSRVPLDLRDDKLDLGFKKKDDEDSEPVGEPSFPVLDPHHEPSTQIRVFLIRPKMTNLSSLRASHLRDLIRISHQYKYLTHSLLRERGGGS